MTTVEDNIVSAAKTHLTTKPDVLAVLGAFPGTLAPYLFQNSMWTNLENSQSTAGVLSYAGGWINPNLHNTMRFPRLRLELLADPLRDENHNPTDPAEVRLRIEHAYKVIDRHLHHPQGRTQMWGTLRILTCLRMLEPTIEPVPDGTGMVRLNVTYAVTEG